MTNTSRNSQRIHRAARSRAKMTGNAARPRLVCFRSLRHYELQLVDDVRHVTLGSVSTKGKNCATMKAADKIAWLGSEIAKLCQKHNAKAIVFDRGGYTFTGNLAKVADAIKKQGITI